MILLISYSNKGRLYIFKSSFKILIISSRSLVINDLAILSLSCLFHHLGFAYHITVFCHKWNCICKSFSRMVNIISNSTTDCGAVCFGILMSYEIVILCLVFYYFCSSIYIIYDYFFLDISKLKYWYKNKVYHVHVYVIT